MMLISKDQQFVKTFIQNSSMVKNRPFSAALLAWWLLLALLTSVVQVAAAPVRAAASSASPEAALQIAAAENVATLLDERARRFWEARTNGDLATMYDYETEKLTGRLSLAQYVRRKGRIIYKSAKVLGSEIIGKDRAVVNVVVEVVIPGLSGAVESNVEDEWVYVDGLWYHGTMSKKAEN